VPNPKNGSMIKTGQTASGSLVVKHNPQPHYTELPSAGYSATKYEDSGDDEEYARFSPEEEGEGSNDNGGVLINIELYTELGCEKPWPAVGPALTLPNPFTLRDAHTKIRQWLDECCKTHGLACSGGNPVLPTRVIDVGSGPSPTSPSGRNPFIYESSPGEKAEYLVLSHCWGDTKLHPPPLKLLRSNLTSRKEFISLSELPLTFLETVLLTRALGFRYVWIDSLCIVQDDASDWEREAARMADVYRLATLTISADGASNSGEGLLAPVGENRRSRSVELRTETGVPFFARKTSFMADRETTTVHMIAEEGPDITSSTRNAPLRTRGWTFQEWVLSSRIVHFTKGELLWECNTHRGCECQVNDVGSLRPPQTPEESQRFSTGIQSRRDRFKALYDGVVSSAHDDQDSRGWAEVITEFTKRQLTFDKDRLPATSGLAGLMSSRAGVTPEEYMAGHWKAQLPGSLLWYANWRSEPGAETAQVLRHCPRSYAPSWSWASITGSVAFTRGGKLVDKPEIIAEVLEVGGSPATANQFGPVRDAYIKLRSYVGIFPLESPSGKGGALELVRGTMPLANSCNQIELDVWPEAEVEVCGEDVEKLAFVVIASETYLNLDCEILYVLALLPVNSTNRSSTVDDNNQVYKRVGYAELSCDDAGMVAERWKKESLKLREAVIVII